MNNLSDLWTVIEQELLSILQRIDAEEAARVQAAGCPHCGAVLHRADYPRKPRGVDNLPPEWDWRLSFCCAQCRRRLTPQSVRFLGRKVYLGVVILIACVLRGHGEKLERVAGRLRLKLSTLGRWQAWWRRVTETGWWTTAQARIVPPLGEGSFITLLYERFRQSAVGAGEAASKLLTFASPLTAPGAYPV
jgi:hypothetical protein